MYLIHLGKGEVTSIETMVSLNQPLQYITCSGSQGIEIKVNPDSEVLFDESNQSSCPEKYTFIYIYALY